MSACCPKPKSKFEIRCCQFRDKTFDHCLAIIYLLNRNTSPVFLSAHLDLPGPIVMCCQLTSSYTNSCTGAHELLQRSARAGSTLDSAVSIAALKLFTDPDKSSNHQIIKCPPLFELLLYPKLRPIIGLPLALITEWGKNQIEKRWVVRVGAD